MIYLSYIISLMCISFNGYMIMLVGMFFFFKARDLILIVCNK